MGGGEIFQSRDTKFMKKLLTMQVFCDININVIRDKKPYCKKGLKFKMKG